MVVISSVEGLFSCSSLDLVRVVASGIVQRLIVLPPALSDIACFCDALRAPLGYLRNRDTLSTLMSKRNDLTASDMDDIAGQVKCLFLSTCVFLHVQHRCSIRLVLDTQRGRFLVVGGWFSASTGL